MSGVFIHIILNLYFLISTFNQIILFQNKTSMMFSINCCLTICSKKIQIKMSYLIH